MQKMAFKKIRAVSKDSFWKQPSILLNFKIASLCGFLSGTWMGIWS